MCRQGDQLTDIFFLLKGKLQVDQFHLDGNQAVFSFEKPFSMIGDLELFQDDEVSCNVQALEDSLVFAAPAQLVREVGYNDAQLLRFIIGYLTKKLYSSSRLLSNAPLSVEYRLARYLLYRFDKEGAVLRLEKRESLAAMLGVSVRHLNRTFKQLGATSVITLQNKTLTINHLDYFIEITGKET